MLLLSRAYFAELQWTVNSFGILFSFSRLDVKVVMMKKQRNVSFETYVSFKLKRVR